MFRPEFLNRIDEIITFSRLDRSCIASIVRNQLERVAKRLEDKKLSLSFTDDAVEFLAEVGYDPLFGARPIKRAIQMYLENPLAKEILAGRFTEGATISVDKASDGNALSFS